MLCACTPSNIPSHPLVNIRANPEWIGNLEITFLGNTTILLSDQKRTLLIDGFLSRPGLFKVAFGKILYDKAEITRQLQKIEFEKIDSLIMTHSHYDHALDSPVIANEYSANLIGSEDVYKIAADQFGAMEHPKGECAGNKISIGPHRAPVFCGEFKIWLEKASRHSHLPVGMNEWLLDGTIDSTVDFSRSQRVFKYKESESYNVFLEHPAINMFFLVGHLGANSRIREADMVFVSLPILKEMLKDSKEEKTLPSMLDSILGREAKVHLVPVHWDNFFRSLDKPLEIQFTLQSTVKKLMEVQKDRSSKYKILWMQAFNRLVIGN